MFGGFFFFLLNLRSFENLCLLQSEGTQCCWGCFWAESKQSSFFFPPSIDDVFLPKDLDPTEMDEIDREVEYFKR